jgi:cation transport ATPase
LPCGKNAAPVKVKYKIKEHISFKFRYPIRLSNVETCNGNNKADGRCSRSDKIAVNVLVMAKDKKKNKKVTAGELFGKLGKHNRDDVSSQNNIDEEEISFIDDGKTDDSIDVSGTQEDNDSDLDINELLRKYMPDYDSSDDGNTSSDEPTTQKTGGILSRLKNTVESEDAVTDENETSNKPTEDEQLISSLDSAFGIPSNKKNDSSFLDEYDLEPESDADINFGSDDGAETFADEEVTESAEPDSDNTESENQEENTEIEEEFGADIEEEIAETADTPKKQKKSIFSIFGKNKEKKKQNENTDDEVAEFITDNEDEQVPNYTGFDSADNNTAQSDSVLTNEEVIENSETSKLDTEVSDSEVADEKISDAEIKDEASTEAADNTADDIGDVVSDAENDEQDDSFDPTDINLMVAFGLDGKDNSKAKEFGDKLEAKQHSRENRKVKIDHPEFVDKTQIPAIRKEFREKKISLWIRFAICSVITLLLLIFENIEFFTKLFTGTSQQFSGFMDPAVYPVVYIMISLQLMLLACYCAVGEIIQGVKSIFRGSPTPYSMTALLTLGGIIYSAVLAMVTVSPNEPVMFNFVTAVSAMLTLIAAMYNNKRETMNFAVVANRRTKHIVRRLPDEESEGEAKAFAERDDACDVMKIEKTDFIDGFFGRLYRPDSTAGVFMTFVMSASVAIAVLLGIFVNFRGGDSATICRVVYSAVLMLLPLSAYITFSYPMYRANVAAKEYDSAIIGDSSLEEYSNASIISFDDKNVFPSYSVKVQNMRIYNNARIDRVLYYAASVFAYAGGPLQDVFEVATKDMGVSKNVEIFDTEAGFLATQVDGVNIIFGSSENLQSRGLEIPEGALTDDVDLSDELSIMYMFREDKLVAKMYIKYVMDSDIDLILKQFSGSGLYVCVRTFDPNIDESMIAKKAGMKKMPLKILRYANADEVGKYEKKVDSGLVTCGSPKSLLQVITYCGKVLHTKKTDIALGVLSLMISTALLVLLLLSNSLTILTSLLIVVYQIFWIITIAIASKVFIR